MLKIRVDKQSVHKGSQSVLFVPTVAHVYDYKGGPCVRRINFFNHLALSWLRRIQMKAL